MVPLQTTPYLRPLQLIHSLVYKHFDINLKVASCFSHGDKMEFSFERKKYLLVH